MSIALGHASALAQSAADLSARLDVDAQLDDFTPFETIFRNADICTLVAPPESCGVDEEPADDSAWSSLQDVQQLFVTWDAERLYLGASGTIAGHALVLLLDYRSGGLDEMSGLEHWRRAVRFGDVLRPDALVTVRDGAPTPELWLVPAQEAVERVASEDYAAAASFSSEAPGRSLELAIPWVVLFPGAIRAVNPDALAPHSPMFVLPPEAARGLRVAALVVHAEDGLSGADAAPNAHSPPPLDPRLPVLVDRAAFVEWDAAGEGPLRFIDFDAAVQTQASPRFVADSLSSPGAPVRIDALRTFRAADPTGGATRLVAPDAELALGFAFDVVSPAPAVLYLSSSVVSLRGEQVVELFRDALRSCVASASPYSCFGDAARDRWDGLDAAGRPVPGGVYVLVVTAGPSPGTKTTQARRTIAVVH